MQAVSNFISGEQPVEPNFRIVEKWGDGVALGFVAVPDMLLVSQAKLGLDPTEIVVLLNVLSYWWFQERKPFPRSSTIAKRMGTSSRTIQRALTRLQHKGILVKSRNNKGLPVFDPSPLVEKLQFFSRDDPRYLAKGGN